MFNTLLPYLLGASNVCVSVNVLLPVVANEPVLILPPPPHEPDCEPIVANFWSTDAVHAFVPNIL